MGREVGENEVGGGGVMETFLRYGARRPIYLCIDRPASLAGPSDRDRKRRRQRTDKLGQPKLIPG